MCGEQSSTLSTLNYRSCSLSAGTLAAVSSELLLLCSSFSSSCFTATDGASLFSMGWHLAGPSIPLIVNYSQNMELGRCTRLEPSLSSVAWQKCIVGTRFGRWHLEEQSATVLHVCEIQSHGNQPQRAPPPFITVYYLT